MKATRPRPVVTLPLNESIQKLVGDYNLETQDLIWEIADNQRQLVVGCECQEDLDSNVQKFIDTK